MTHAGIMQKGGGGCLTWEVEGGGERGYTTMNHGTVLHSQFPFVIAQSDFYFHNVEIETSMFTYGHYRDHLWPHWSWGVGFLTGWICVLVTKASVHLKRYFSKWSRLARCALPFAYGVTFVMLFGTIADNMENPIPIFNEGKTQVTCS